MARSVAEIEADREAVKLRLDALDAELAEVGQAELIAKGRACGIDLPSADKVYDHFLAAVGAAVENIPSYEDCDESHGRSEAEDEETGLSFSIDVGLPIAETDEEAA